MRLSGLAATHLRLLFLLAAAAGVGASYWHHATNAARLQAALDSLQSCRQLAHAIRAAERSPRRARLESWSLDDLGTAVEKAAADARLAVDRVLRIDPQAPKRLGKTDYLEQATEVELLAVTLQQLVDFVYGVSGSDDQLYIGTLRLREPHDTADSANQELWLADVVLTQRIYAPTTPHRW